MPGQPWWRPCSSTSSWGNRHPRGRGAVLPWGPPASDGAVAWLGAGRAPGSLRAFSTSGHPGGRSSGSSSSSLRRTSCGGSAPSRSPSGSTTWGTRWARCCRSAPSWLAKRPMRTSGGVAGQWSSASVGPAAGDVHGARIVPDKGSLPQLKDGQSVDSRRRALRSPQRGSCQTSRETDEAKRAKQPPGHSEIAARDQMAQLT
jgi:hypothetical protein